MSIETITLVLQIALGIVMLGLGLHLTVADFRRVMRYPRAAVVGLACQLLLLPGVAFGLAVAFRLPPELAVGLLLLSASPGGVTANLYSHLAHGDVALNITLTAINSLLCLITLPVIVGLGLEYFMAAEQSVPIPFIKVLGVFAIVIVPVSLGMTLRHFAPKVAKALDRPVRLLSVVVLVVAIGASLWSEHERLLQFLGSVGLAALLFNLISLTVGYLAPRLFGIDKRQSIAVGMEIGIHNGTLAIAVATGALGSLLMAAPAAIYSIFMFITAAGFGWLVSRGIDRHTGEAPANS
jgi:BASS family bile acid:Na+ symporter